MEAVELRYSFKHSESYFWSYLSRTVIETACAGVLLVYMILRGVPILQHSENIICDVHGHYYEVSLKYFSQIFLQIFLANQSIIFFVHL